MSSTTIPPLNVRITAQDTTGPTLDKFGKKVQSVGGAAQTLGDRVKRLGESSGVNRLSEGFKSLSVTTGDSFRAVSQLAPAMATLTGATTIAGMTALVARFGQLGQQAYLTGQRLGLPTDRLTALHGAARLAGSSSEALDAGLSSLDERLRGATFRGDSTAIQTFGLLGVQFRKDATHARDAGEALGDVADGIKRIYDNGRGRGAALRAAQNLGMGDLFPLLIKGRAGIQGLSAEAARMGSVITPAMADRANKFRQSWTDLGLAIEGVENRLGDRWGHAVKPYIDGAANWIAKNKEVADSYATIGAGIMALGAIRPAAWLARLLGITTVGPAAALAASIPLGRHLTGDDKIPVDKDHPYGGAGGLPIWLRRYFGGGPVSPHQQSLEGWLADQYRRHAPAWAGGNSPSPRLAPLGAPPKPGTAAFDTMKKIHDFWISKGFSEQQVAGILANVAAESGFNPNSVGDGGTSYGLYQHHADRRAALFARYGDHPTVEQQDQFAWDELNDPARRSTLNGLRAANSASDAASVWTYGYENPRDARNEALRRGAAAGRYEGAVSVHVDITGAPPGTKATATGSGAVRVPPPRVETAMPTH